MKKHDSKEFKMPRNETGCNSSYQHVSLLLVSHGENGKRDIDLLGTKRLEGKKRMWSTHFPNGENS